MKTIIFLNGVMMSTWLAKSKFLWDQTLWSDYNCVWVSSKLPYSDMMVGKELDRLQRLLEQYPNATLAGQSLGAWWAANLACRSNCNISKMVLWTPLVNHLEYPIFNVTARYHPYHQTPNPNNTGLHKALVFYGDEDLIVPQQTHAYYNIMHFKALSYKLHGGHLLQKNHQAALKYMKDWIETP